MAKRAEQTENGLLVIHDLDSPDVQLDLTTDPWRLQDGQASMVIGLDVVRPGSFQPDRGRRSLGISSPSEHPLTTIFGSTAQVTVPARYRNILSKAADGPTDQFPFEGVTPDSPGSFVYTPSNGNVTKTNAFLAYTFVAGDLGVVTTRPTLGFYRVLSQASVSQIRIKSGLEFPSNAMTIRVMRDVETVITVPIESEWWFIKSPKLYNREGPWPASMKDQALVTDADGRIQATGTAHIIRVDTFDSTNDALVIISSTGIGTWRSKFNVFYTATGNARGIWVSDGRKFWVHQNGSWVLKTDFEDDALLGIQWQVSHVAPNRFLVTSELAAPRIIYLHKFASGAETLAGCLSPGRPRYSEDPAVATGPQDQSWVMDEVNATPGLTVGDEYRTKVRMSSSDSDDSLQSVFWDVAKGTMSGGLGSQTSVDPLTISAAGKGISIFPVNNNTNPSNTPPLHPRWTHVQVWRTTGNAETYYFEREMELAKVVPDIFTNEPINSGSDVYGNLFKHDPFTPSVSVSDGAIQAVPAATQADLRAGGLPPICRRSVSLEGITLCFGQAHPDAIDPTVYNADFFKTTYSYAIVSGVAEISNGNFGAGYVFKEGDQFVVVHGGRGSSGPVPLGAYAIGGEIDDSTIFLKEVPFPFNLTPSTLRGFIRRPFVIPYPRIQSDEDVWYSRTDIFSPESFSGNVIRLSRKGDVFRNAVRVGNYVAVIMNQGVYLLFLEGAGLGKPDTVSDADEGTPWADSVIVWKKTAIWANPDGIKSLVVSNDPDQEGHRGRIQPLGGDRFRSWFRDAYDKGENIDAGVDELNQCLRWRRHLSNGDYQVLQASFLTNRWTLLNDDAGDKYALASSVEQEDNKPVLYAVNSQGNVFQVNNLLPEFSYLGYTVEGILKDYDYNAISLQGEFSSSMVGDVVRFYVGDDQYTRVISDFVVDRIIFPWIDTLTDETYFTIGASPTRVRWAHLSGSDKDTEKTIFDAGISAFAGERGPGEFTIKTIRNFKTALDQRTVKAFDPESPGETPNDRVSSIAGQGQYLELELESRSPRSDFKLDQLQIRLRDEE